MTPEDHYSSTRTFKKLAPVMIGAVAIDTAIGVSERVGADRSRFVENARSSALNGVGALAVSNAMQLLYAPIYAKVEHISPFQRRRMTRPLDWVILFVGADLTIYWYHRKAHEIALLWAAHNVHHSSDHLSSAVGFRRKWNQVAEKGTWLPLIWLGFPTKAVFVVQAYHLFYGIFCHTERIGKLPKWYENVFVTPSHHRVHHGVEKEYLDKNYGNWLILWDKMFGTFQPEMQTSNYGTLDEISTTSVVGQQTLPTRALLARARAANSVSAALAVLFGRP